MEILVGNLYDKRESFSNRWLKVDTSCLFMDQYNTTEDCGNLRILDKDVIAVRGDIRKDYCRCGYCGKVFKVGEEEKHFKEMENSKDCNSCWYFKDEREYEHKPELKEVIQREDGTFDEVFTKVMICHHSVKKCTFENGCQMFECRKHKIEYFSNGYFVQHPNGRFDWGIEKWLSINNFYHDFQGRDLWTEISDGYYQYRSKFGRFELYFSLSEMSFTVTGKDFHKVIAKENALRNQYGLLPMDKKTYRKLEQDIGYVINNALYGLKYRKEFYDKYESIFKG